MQSPDLAAMLPRLSCHQSHSRASSPRFDTPNCNPVVDVVLVEANVFADFVKGDASFAHKAANESFGRAETLGELRDAEHRTFDVSPLDGGFADHRVLLGAVDTADVESMPLRI